MNKYMKKFFLDLSDIGEYYSYLVDKTKHLEYIGITNEWLVDNYYLLVEHKNNITESKKEINKLLRKNNNIYEVLEAILIKNNYNIDYKILVKEINRYQNENTYFSYKEIDTFVYILLFIYVSKLNELSHNEYQALSIKEKVERIIKTNSNKEVTLDTFFDKEFTVENNYRYLFEVNNALKEMGTKASKVFMELNKALDKQGVSIKDIVNKLYQERIDNDMLISTIFRNLKDLFDITKEDLYKKVSKCEEYLLEDDIYSKMTDETKDLYRKKIVKLSNKEHTSEITYIKNLMDNSTSETYHIGTHLFPYKSNKLRSILYIGGVIISSTTLSFILSYYFIDSILLGFIILFIPVSQLILQIVNKLLTNIVRPYPLPKIDYSKGVTTDSKTMFVIPTIIGTTDKIKSLFDNLETVYLINKSNNIYFTLLGDVKASNKQVEDFDKDLIIFGKEYAESLNKKYGKELFYFVYRKRLWNEKEGQYLGYERKRGALLQLNKLLLHKMTQEEKTKYFNISTLDDFKEDIKYVVTLDSDTKLVLNTALNLIGCMAHPLNKPILNKEKTRVVKGYALMQPRVSFDIDSTNKSLYSQIFAGIGGFDTYSSLVPNLYQDTFYEGSFVGKGIYDLKVFDQILDNRFPDNLILSHDLLEGNYLRCAYVSDVEFVDDFPSKFLVDVTRHHRWARGDVQIISWLGSKIKNKQGKKENNPLNSIEKWKIFDNISRMFLYPTLLLILLLGVTISKSPSWIWIILVLLEIALPILFFLRSKMYNTNKSKKTTIYYKNLMFGGKSLLLRTYIIFATLPYYTRLYMDAFLRTVYRLTISHKNLLNWITAEDVEKNVKTGLKAYLNNFKETFIISTIMIVFGLFSINIYLIIFALIFITSPFILNELSTDIDHTKKKLEPDELDDVKDIAYKTWNYFNINLKEEYHYLIPDNYQENREDKIDLRTSPTNIGFSLLSVISAYELEFINDCDALDLLNKIVQSIKSLEKWHGHLYNWYDIKTKKIMHPAFVSTVDSGNLVAALVIVKEFAKNKDYKLSQLCEKLIKATNFKKLYTKKEVFSIGYDESEGKLSIYNYNKFASESRLTSYLAIALGEVPSKHWFCLDKSLTTHNIHKGLISWSGTSFEYYMPLLFMKNYPNTLLDETYSFAHICQKDYIESVNRRLPWGISESAYDELDNANNYKYQSFSTPYLKAKEDKVNKIVISPYSSLMALELFPEDIYNNIKKFKKMNMLSKYGFYESYDNETKGIVKAVFAHHSGMSLVGITNYLKDNAIKNYFHSDVNIKTFDILLKEKVQVKTSIDMNMAKYKKYNYTKEKIENDIRVFNYISNMPEVGVLSNRKYCLLANDRGNSFSRYRTLQLNRYRKVTEQDYGIFMYIKDLDSNEIWSNTYAPTNKKANKYEVVFSADKIKYLRTDNKITTSTEIIVTKNHHAEIRKITFKNESDEFRHLELTTYTEPILSENTDDIAHKVFNNMFLNIKYDSKTNSLIAIRKPRVDNKLVSYMFNRLLVPNPISEYEYETDRFNFLGRNNTTQNPIALDKKLSNKSGVNVEPILSLRNSIEIAPNSSETVYLICGFGRSEEQINEIINSYNTKSKIKQAFKLSALNSIMLTKTLNITGSNMRVFNIMLNYLYQTTRIGVSKTRNDVLKLNALPQHGLWKFGISGDRPIILVNITDISDMTFVEEILKAFEYYKNNSIFVDIVIVNNETTQYSKIIKKEVSDELYRMYTLNNFYHTPGTVTVIDGSTITAEEKVLLKMVPRLYFDVSSHKSLEEQVNDLQENNTISDYESLQIEENIEPKEKLLLEKYNEFGGFTKNGDEYIITNKNTPTPWSNVIANRYFGTIVTNNGCGFTYFYNSGEYKITSWSNEMVVNDKSEFIKINNKVFDPTTCTHGFGYSILKSEDEILKKEVCEYVPEKDSVKVYLVKLTNKTKSKQDLNVTFSINPVLGNFEEKTSRHILTEFMGNDNYLKLRNVYSNDYSDVNVFMSSSEQIISTVNDKILNKEITVKVELKQNEEKTIVFTLGASYKIDELEDIVKKYNNLNSAQAELDNTKDFWRKIVKTVDVKTPDDNFNYMINGWYLYQTISARIMAKSGFYQVSGAFGYRDQLQDSMNIAIVKPDYCKEQIIRNAKHQFIEGDVLHWWHEKTRFGLRSRYKDDYLWLVLATVEYIKTTNDSKILDEMIPFVEGETLSANDNEKGIIFNYSKKEATLLDHLILSLRLAMNSLGPHKLPLMGGGDWNDGMNKVGIKGKGESVWLGFFLYWNINKFIRLIPKIKPDFDTSEYIEFNEKLKKNLNKYAWDKDYYLRAYYDNGDKLGSSENTECKIDLISQSFAILSNVATTEKKKKAMDSVEKYLVDKENKIVKLLTPAFENSKNDPGYIMKYPKGIRENGGEYTHAVSWYIMALIKQGEYDEAYEVFQMINPVNRTLTKKDVLKYKVEPYVIAADIYSAKGYEARGGWSWYTGSAGWFYKVGLRDIIGFRKNGDNLTLKPHIPSTWNDFKIKYTYMDTVYNIIVSRSNKNEVYLDKKQVKNNNIKLVNDKKKHNIEVYFK